MFKSLYAEEFSFRNMLYHQFIKQSKALGLARVVGDDGIAPRWKAPAAC